MFGSGSTFVIYIILARELGTENFGLFASILSMATIFTILADFGVSQFWLKIFGKDGWNGVRWISPSLRFLFFVIVIVLALFSIWALWGPHDKVTRQILFVMSFFILSRVSVNLVSSKLQLEEKYVKLALWQLLPNLSRLIIIAVMVYSATLNINVHYVAWIYAMVGMVFISLGIYQIYQMKNGEFDLKGHQKIDSQHQNIPLIRNVFSESWPFGMASIFAFVYVQSDIIMVKYIAGNTQAGYYNVAYVIIKSILVFPTVLYQKYFLPKYHRWANHNRKKFYMAYKKGNLAMLISGSIVMIGLLLLSSWMIPIIFGKEYQDSVVLTNILALIIPIYFVSYSAAATLVTQDNMKIKIKYMGITATINIILNYFLINRFDAFGAAIATFISYAILLSLYLYATKKYVFSKEIESSVLHS